MLNIIVFILGLSFLIMVHELGHFLVAKAFRVYCYEFSIGMGPLLFQKKKGETKYSLRALPIGGYVSMAGEEVNQENLESENEEENKEENKEVEKIPYERTINGINPWKRFLVISAGVIMNFVIAFILFFISIVATGLPNEAPFLNVNYDSSSEEYFAFKDAGIKEGVIEIKTAINNIEIVVNGNSQSVYSKSFTNFDSFDTLSDSIGLPSELGSYLLNNFNASLTSLDKENKEYDFYVLNDPNIYFVQNLTLTTDSETYNVSRNVYKLEFAIHKQNKNVVLTNSDMIKLGYTQASRKAGFFEAIDLAFKTEVENGTLIFRALGTLFTKEGISQVGGVIAMADMSQTFLSYGFGYYMLFLGVISVNLGIMNLLPIPGLDGSQLLVIIVEEITRKKLNNKTKAIINFIGLIFLIGLMILVTIKDVLQYII